MNKPSDVEDLTTFYDNLPSIFENNPSPFVEQSSNVVDLDVNIEKSYQPMFGSFLFADSDPLSRAAFVVSSSATTEVDQRQERVMDDSTSNDAPDISSRIQRTSSPRHLAAAEDIDDNDDEDDFDGIPIRHSSMMMKKKLNGDSDAILNHVEHDHLFDAFVHHIDDVHDDNDIEDDAFLNGFNDEQHDTTAIVPSLFKDIPDIDDSNIHDEDDDDDNDHARVPFDQIDMFDQSDSIRSSSPDSLLSSSHLQDEQDDDGAIDDDVAQWNDDDVILHITPSNVSSQINRANSPLVSSIHPFNQVDFIDSSRSNSRCSNVSSHLSIGYTDQARIFMSDDGLDTSSDSDDDDGNHDNMMKLDCDTFDRDGSEELCLQVNLDDRHSPSSFKKSNSTRSSAPSSIPDETPIVDMDEENNEQLQTVHVAPIAALDDDDDDDDDDLQTSTSAQRIWTSNIKNPLEFKSQIRQKKIIDDIIHMQQIFNENDQDDEFLAVMHNPSIFEQVLSNSNHHDDDKKKSDLIKQTNSVPSTLRPSAQLSINKETAKESFEHHQTIHQTHSLVESNDETTPASSSSPYTRKTTTTPTVNNFSLTAVNHLARDDAKGNEDDISVSAVDTVDTLQIKQKTHNLSQQQQTNTFDMDVKQFTHNNNDYPTMSTDDDSDDDDDDDDLELLQTLSQLHGIINTTPSSEETHPLESSFPTSSMKKEETSPDSSCNNNTIIKNGNETDLSNMKSQTTSHIKPSSSFANDTRRITDDGDNDKQEERDEKKNVIFYKNLNDDHGNGKQKQKYERKEQEKNTPTTFFSSTSSTSPSIFFTDDSHSSVDVIDPDTSSSLPNLLLSNEIDDLSLLTHQLITDDLQISTTKSNMNNSPNNDHPDQTTSNLFDPFAPATTTPTTTTITTTGMFEDVFANSKDTDGMRPQFSPSNSTSTQSLANYNFDDLWNQSISQITSSNHDIDPTAFTWDAFVNNDKTNSVDDTANVSASDITWQSLFGDKQQAESNDLKEFLHWIISHLDHSEPHIEFTSIHNLESIVKDMQMCALPFEPIPSPPLHVDHTVNNPMINAVHHDLFPIAEIEQPNMSENQPSMIIFEEDEEQSTNDSFAAETSVKPMVEKLVSNTLHTALTEVTGPHQHVEHFVDQVIAQAIFEVHDEDKSVSKSEINDPILTENLASILSWHEQTKATKKQLLDPFDQKFDSVWSSHFEAPDDTTNANLFDHDNKNDIDPWLTATTAATEFNNNVDSMTLFSKTFDDSDLFSSTNNNPEIEDDETGTLSEYVPPSILTNPSNAITTANDLLKYTLTAPVMDDSGDDSSVLEDYLVSRKNDSSVITDIKVNKEPVDRHDITLREQQEMETDEPDNFFSKNARLSQFEIFASDQPLNSPEVESKFANMTSQFDNEFGDFSSLQQSTGDNAPWISVGKASETVQASGIGDNEPWELEDHGEEKITPVPTTTRLSAFNDNEFSSTDKSELQSNFFSDSFNPSVSTENHSNTNKEHFNEHFTKQQSNDDIDQSAAKSVRFNDHIQNIRVPTPTIDMMEESKSSTRSDSDDVELDDIIPSFEKVSDHMQTSYVNVDKTDAKPERPYESVELPLLSTRLESERVPSPLKDKTNTFDDNIPLKSAVILSNTNTQYK